MDEKQKKEVKIAEMEKVMEEPDFWSDKNRAQTLIRELKELKGNLDGKGQYYSSDAVMTIFSGAGGDDAEDFSAILLRMYLKYFDKVGFKYQLIHENKNDHGGFRNITLEIRGKDAYGILKNESGVHRLVRISPFNAKKLRHTSFSMVEIIPKFEKAGTIEIPETDLRIEFARSSGPGGQNVNKRETAVRIVHVPTNLSVHADSERSQHANRQKALEILEGKIYKRLEEERIAKEKGMYISKTTSVEWGNQIRSYVMHPYKMVKDHRTSIETAKIDDVLEGEIEMFIEGERSL